MVEYVVPLITIVVLHPLVPTTSGLPPAPPPPTVTAPMLAPPVSIFERFLAPPAPPPPAREAPPPPPPPPATINVLTNLVPGCVVILGVLDVLIVCVFLPRDVMFVGPIIPPLPAII